MVAREEAEILTILFPIRIALSIFVLLSIIFFTRKAFLLFSSIKVLILILLTVVKAVSADEKNADKKIRKIRIISIVISLVDNFFLLFYHYYYE